MQVRSLRSSTPDVACQHRLLLAGVADEDVPAAKVGVEHLPPPLRQRRVLSSAGVGFDCCGSRSGSAAPAVAAAAAAAADVEAAY